MIFAKSDEDFGPGPLTIETDSDLADALDDERMILAFADFEGLFTVIGRARGAMHFGMFLTSWYFTHWRAEQRRDTWSMRTTDRAEIMRLRRFYHLSP